jgi:peroxiredoxin
MLGSLAAAGGVLAGCARPSLAPAFDYTLLDGTRAHSAAQRGKVVMVSFWATSCAICMHEMPQLVATHRRYAGRPFELLAVAMAYDPPARVAHVAESRRLPFGVVIDNTGAIARAFGDVRGTPTHVLIDRRGLIVRRIEGAPDFAALHGLIDGLLTTA